jgi:hypothetical protein
MRSQDTLRWQHGALFSSWREGVPDVRLNAPGFFGIRNRGDSLGAVWPFLTSGLTEVDPKSWTEKMGFEFRKI